jgi:hypothetical protein
MLLLRFPAPSSTVNTSVVLSAVSKTVHKMALMEPL